MRRLTDESPRGDAGGSVVTIGVFDGVHRGHRRLIERVVGDARERGLSATVVTFSPHPARVIDPTHAPRMIESLERRLCRFEELGVDQARVITFNDRTAQEGPEEFVERVVAGELRARRVVVGDDFRFGRKRSGSVATLVEAGARLGFEVESIDAVGDPRGRFSSTVARTAIEAGELEEAERVLGHHVVVSGEVIHGDGRGGAELGFPTANLALPNEVVRPGLGIYAGAVLLRGTAHTAAVSIGRRPQYYEHGTVLCEAHLTDFDGDLYGEYLDVVLLRRLRPELKFENVAALVAQMTADVAAARFFGPEVRARGLGLIGFLPGQ